MKFKIGDRVRIVGSHFKQNSIAVGKEGIVVGPFDKYPSSPVPGYKVNIVGYTHPLYGAWVVEPENMRPLINPDEQAWEAFKSLHLKPDPALILAKVTA